MLVCDSELAFSGMRIQDMSRRDARSRDPHWLCLALSLCSLDLLRFVVSSLLSRSCLFRHAFSGPVALRLETPTRCCFFSFSYAVVVRAVIGFVSFVTCVFFRTFLQFSFFILVLLFQASEFIPVAGLARCLRACCLRALLGCFAFSPPTSLVDSAHAVLAPACVCFCERGLSLRGARIQVFWIIWLFFT